LNAPDRSTHSPRFVTQPFIPLLPRTEQGRIPSLDGLRAVSIVAVLLGHLAGTKNFPTVVEHVLEGGIVSASNLGVRIFFVISGLLITSLLMDEQKRFGGISLRSFFVRRAFRIIPAYAAFLGVLALLGATNAIELPLRDFLFAISYTVNYSVERSWYIGHLWSLAVEEQFYLLWPLLLTRIGGVSARSAAIYCVLGVPVIRTVLFTLFPAYRPIVGSTFETAADAIAMGCVAALSWPTVQRLLDRRSSKMLWVVIGCLFLSGALAALRVRSALLIGVPLQNLSITLMICLLVLRPLGTVGAVLNSKAFVYFGALSYSIYLWQQLFLNRSSGALSSQFPQNILLALGAGYLSFYLIEQPALRLRIRLSSRTSS
jgi:peptidoglycan/LPS O-acetylase OafA/YrhL